jgi:hypothetical protein
MSKFAHHIFVCINERPKGDPRGCCSALGSVGLHAFFKKEVERLGLKGIVRANKAGCLDQCEYGPSVVIYPEGVWYWVGKEARNHGTTHRQGGNRGTASDAWKKWYPSHGSILKFSDPF